LPRESKRAKRERTLAIIERLKGMYPESKCSLTHENPLQLLVATVLSAQTTDAAVNRATPALFARFRTAADFAGAEQEEMERYVASLGFFRSKSRSLIGLGRALVERHGGEVPVAARHVPEHDERAHEGRGVLEDARERQLPASGGDDDVGVEGLGGPQGLVGEAVPEQVRGGPEHERSDDEAPVEQCARQALGAREAAPLHPGDLGQGEAQRGQHEHLQPYQDGEAHGDTEEDEAGDLVREVPQPAHRVHVGEVGRTGPDDERGGTQPSAAEPEEGQHRGGMGRQGDGHGSSPIRSHSSARHNPSPRHIREEAPLSG